MENITTQERVLAFNLATEIVPEEIDQISGGTKNLSTWHRTQHTTMGGQDHDYDMDPD